MTTEESEIMSAEAKEAEDLALAKEAEDLAHEKSLIGADRPEPQMMWLPVSTLLIDPRIQRHLSVDRVNKIAQGYNTDAVGVLTASRRVNGKYYCLDGQHRKAAMELLGLGSTEVQVKVFEGLTEAQEALLFRLLNNTKKPMPVDIFKVKLLEGDPLAKQMFQLLVKYEWRLRGGVADGNFMAVKTMERLFEIDPDLAETTVNILCGAWGNRTGTLNDALLAGMGRLLLKRGDAIDGSHLIAKLQSVPGGPREVINKALTLRDALNLTRQSAVAMVLVDIYNTGLRTRKLDDWTEK